MSRSSSGGEQRDDSITKNESLPRQAFLFVHTRTGVACPEEKPVQESRCQK